jgi:hypothetical protein
MINLQSNTLHDKYIIKKQRNHHLYRKIYKSYHGTIPKDQTGRTYEIHHVDGNPENNSKENLVALSLQDHYDLHFSQGDFEACSLMASHRMNKTPEELSEIARLAALQQIEKGTHPWVGDGTHQRKVQRDRLASGTHNLMKRLDGTSLASDRVANGTHQGLKRSDGTSMASDRVKAGKCNLSKRPDGTSVVTDAIAKGTNAFANGKAVKKQMEEGTHPSQQKWECEVCGKIGHHRAAYTRFHGEKCRWGDKKNE